MTVRMYSSPAAFKQALEQRLRSNAANGLEFARKRQLLVFDRFLARVVARLDDAVTLKGALVLELRLERARTTNDVDLCQRPADVIALSSADLIRASATLEHYQVIRALSSADLILTRLWRPWACGACSAGSGTTRPQCR
jgi:hypothetical protein